MDKCFLIAVAGVVLTLGTMLMLIQERNNDIQKRAVEVGAAMYTTDAGKFQWVNKDMEYIITGVRK